MKKLLPLIIGLLLLSIAVAHAVPGTIDEVKVDGDELIEGDVNKLSLERGEEFEVKVRVTASSPIANAEVVAFVSGFDFSDEDERISDSSGAFDMTANNTVIKKLRLKIPDRADKDDYRLRVIFSDRNGEEVVKNYRIRIQPPRHSVAIRDIILNPTGSIEAGRSLLVSVRMKNLGDKDEDDIKVTVNIPDLGLTASDFVKEVQADESATSEELFFRIPACARAGTYPVEIELEYDDGFRSVTEEQELTVTASSLCTQQNQDEPSIQPQIAVSPGTLEIVKGEGGAYFTASVTNSQATSKSFYLSAEGANGLQIRFSPSNAVIVQPGDMQNVFVYVAADKNTPVGSQVLTISVKDSTGKSLKSQAVRVDVKQGSAASPGFNFGGDTIQMLGIGLLVLLVILFLLGVYIVFGKQPPTERAEQTKLNKTYY